MSRYGGISGTPWHVETHHLKEDEERRHRSRCKFFNKGEKTCRKLGGRCFGSTHCSYYREVLKPTVQPVVSSSAKSNNKKGKKNPSKAQEKTKSEKQKNYFTIAHREFPKGSHVYHTSFGHGVVKNLTKEHIIIEFDNVGEKTLAVSVCLNNKLLKRLSK